jgi:Cu-processing system permease protein
MTTLKILKYEFHNVIRNRWMIAYALFFLIVTEGLFQFGGDASKVMLSLMNITLLIIPLVSLIFGAMYAYNAREFVELLLSQPVDRKWLFAGMYLGLAVPLAAAFVFGVAVPFSLHGVDDPENLPIVITLVGTGIFLTLIFVALALLIAIVNEDKGRGLGTSILLWLLFAVIYDAILLLATLTFREYPMEQPVIAMTLLNPIDLARIALVLQFDISALMGYTGAVFEKFFGSPIGMMISLASLSVWTGLPFYLGLKRFAQKDF